MFFLRNWRDRNLPDLLAEPMLEEMEKAMERVQGGCKRVKEDKKKGAWPKLHAGDMVRRQEPKQRNGASRGRCWKWSIVREQSM